MPRFKNPSLKVWAVLPLSLIFAAAALRLSWQFLDFAFTSAERALWGLLIAVTITGYFLILRFLFRPALAARFNTQRVRIGAAAGISVAIVIATGYLIQQVPASIAPISRAILGMSFFVVAGGCVFLAILIRPGLLSRLGARFIRVGVSVVISVALVTLAIHTARFLPSELAWHPLSQAMAILLLLALITVYPLLLRFIWRVWQGSGNG